jgi:hypothetical protein
MVEVVEEPDMFDHQVDLAMIMFRLSDVEVAYESSQSDDSFITPVIEFLLQVKGIVVMAMLDTGYSRMLIQHQFCEDNGVEI